MDSLLSIAQMPAGIPVGTLAIGRAGAVNAALLAAAILGGRHPRLRDAVRAFRERQTAGVLADPDPRVPAPLPKPVRPGARRRGHA
jgi:5-(carboxyamino)imidazole ribonucleotide mutase